MPAARMALYQQGIEYVPVFPTCSKQNKSRQLIMNIGYNLAPTADDLPTWTASMQHIAKEGRCFVVTVNAMTRVSDFPADYPPFTLEHPDRRPDGEQWEGR